MQTPSTSAEGPISSANLRTLAVICVTSAFWAFSFGLGSQVVTHWIKGLGASDTVNGLCHSFYYFGLAVGSMAVPTMTRRLGPIACVVIGLLVTGGTLAVFPLAGESWLWYGLRFVNGWAGAMCVVPLETIVSRQSEPGTRTRNFAFYGVSITVGGAVGIAIGLDLCGPGDALPFYVGACLPIVASVLLGLGMPSQSGRSEEESKQPLDWRRNFLSYATAWCQGFIEGGMLAFLSLFLIARGFSHGEAGVLMAVTMIGVILFQVPVAWLADRCGRTPVLLGCYAMVALTLLAIPLLSNWVLLAVGLFAFGACTGAMYPLGLALLGERTPDAGLARAYAWYLAVECVGSQLGAVAMGVARDYRGDAGMFAVPLSAVLLVVAVWTLLRSSQSGKPEQESASLISPAEPLEV